MTREQLEHLIRACSTIAEDDDLVIIGSQSILGQFRASASTPPRCHSVGSSA
jgi:hypothetical protein